MAFSTITRRTLVALGTTVLASLALGVPASAQEFPDRAITLVVPFAAGGSTDVVARIIAQKMSDGLGQQVIVENVGGAGGSLGADRVARAEPDGYTILMGTVATHALNPLILKTKPYDAEKDFAPVSLLVVVPNVLVVNPELPAKTVEELLALLKADPQGYSYASSGNGTPLHLSGQLFMSMTGTEMVHVPYKGSGPALVDAISGDVPINFDNLPSSTGFIKSGALRALAVTTKQRAAIFPDVPTMEEAGVPGYETNTWNALFAPAGTPPEAVARLNAAANAVLADPVVKEKLANVGAETVGGTPEQLAAHVKSEIARWRPVIKAANVQMD